MKRFAAVALLLCSFQHEPVMDAVNKEAMEGYKPEWSGFGVGSWVQVRETVQDVVTERKSVVTKIADQLATVETTTLGAEGAPPVRETHFLGVPSECIGKTAKTSKERTVDGKKLSCTVYTIRMAIHGPTAPHQVEIWKASGTSYWALAYQLKVVRGSVAEKDRRWEVIREKETVKVGSKELECVVIRSEQRYSEEEEDKLVRTEWRNVTVPGHVVRVEEVQPYSEGEKIVREVTAYEVK